MIWRIKNMKEIYVYKQMFGGWKGISKEELDAKVKEGRIIGAELEVDRGDAEKLKITLIKDRFIYFGEVTDKEVQDLIDEYMAYVEEITGMISTQVE
jgi:hypothetical protein